MRRIALAALILLPLIVFTRVGAPNTADAGVPTDLTLSLDCDDVTAGVQSACTVPMGPSVDVELVLTNNTASAVSLSVFEYEVHNTSSARLLPPPIGCTGTCLNSNPDFNLTGANTANWDCGTEPPDNDTGEDGAGTSVSFIGCVDSTSSGPSLAAGASAVLGMVRYAVPTNGPSGTATLSIADAQVADNGLAEIGSCSPVITTSMTCNGATVSVARTTVAIDCSISQPGIQSKCYVSNTLATRDVNVVARNNTNAAFTVGTFNFAVEHLDDSRLFAPPDTTGTSLDRNPDFIADTTDLGDWACAPTDPDNDTYPLASDPGQRSFMSCFNGSGTGPSVAAAATLPLMTVRYNIVAGANPGSVFVTLDDSDVSDASFTSRGNCPAPPGLPTDCQGAELVFYCLIDKADVNNDGRVNSGDLGLVASKFGDVPVPENEDVNFDGAINSGDLQSVASVFNQFVTSCP